MTTGNFKFSHTVIIRENDCIGCTKCIEACPVDAILGTAKQMHTVIQAECIACQLCLPACPVDCMEMVKLPAPRENAAEIAANARMRFQARKKRLTEEKKIAAIRLSSTTPTEQQKKAYIDAVLTRKAKRT